MSDVACSRLTSILYTWEKVLRYKKKADGVKGKKMYLKLIFN